MRLLVSVRNAVEAAAALAGGADIIDAKEPLNGALGAVSADVLRDIAAAVGQAAPVSAALGDACDDNIVSRAASARQIGVTFVKLGFAGMRRRPHLSDDVLQVARLVEPSALVLVAYADYEHADAPEPAELVTIADRLRPAGILLDTCGKEGPGLTSLMPASALASFIDRARTAGRFVAVAGKLTRENLEWVHDAGADVAGVRGAACDGGRCGVVTTERVRALRDQRDSTLTARSVRRLDHRSLGEGG